MRPSEISCTDFNDKSCTKSNAAVKHFHCVILGASCNQIGPQIRVSNDSPITVIPPDKLLITINFTLQFAVYQLIRICVIPTDKLAILSLSLTFRALVPRLFADAAATGVVQARSLTGNTRSFTRIPRSRCIRVYSHSHIYVYTGRRTLAAVGLRISRVWIPTSGADSRWSRLCNWGETPWGQAMHAFVRVCRNRTR